MKQSRKYESPLPKRPILSPDLTRPDWTVSGWRDPKKIWLDKNENLDPELAEITGKILESVVTKTQNLYPDSADLYKKLASWVGVSPQNLMLTPGSDGVIRVVFETFISENDIVLHTVPSFAMYSVYSKMYGVRVVPVEYERVDEKPLLHSQKLIDAIQKNKPRLVCLPNPDSPTGTVFTLDNLRLIIKAAAEIGAVILIDEAYHPFCTITAVPLLSEFPNIIIARTFAKAWGLAGLRIGYSVSSVELTAFMHKVRPMYEVNTIAVATMEKMLDHYADMQSSVTRLIEGKAYFLNEMTSLGFNVLHGEGNFLHVQFGSNSEAIHNALSQIVLYRPDFKEKCLSGYSRFSSTTKENFKIIVEAIRKSINK